MKTYNCCSSNNEQYIENKAKERENKLAEIPEKIEQTKKRSKLT